MAKALPICQKAYDAIVELNKDATQVAGRGNNRRTQKDTIMVAMKQEPRKIFFNSPPGGSFSVGSGAISTTLTMTAAGVAAAAALF